MEELESISSDLDAVKIEANNFEVNMDGVNNLVDTKINKLQGDTQRNQLVRMLDATRNLS